LRKVVATIICLSMISFFAIALVNGTDTPRGPPLILAHTFAIDTHTWDGGDAGVLASAGDNWGTNIAPDTGDAVIWNTGSKACTWDIAKTMGDFTLDTGYTGVVTQTVAFGTHTLAITSGTLTASPDPSTKITISGDLTKAGTLTTNKLYAVMTGDGHSIALSGGNNGGFNQLRVSANITYSSTGSWTCNDFILDFGKTLTLGAGTVFTTYNTGVNTADIDGTITGAGDFYFRNYGLTQTLTTHLGTFTCNQVVFRDVSGSSGTISLASPLVLGCPLNLNDGATSAGILDTTTSNYNISCTDLTVNTYSTLNARGSTITVSGTMDSSAGTFTPGTSHTIMTGASKTLKLKASASVHDLTINAGASTTLASNVIVAGDLVQAGALSIATYILAVTGTSTFSSDMAFTTAGTYTPTGAIACAGDWDTDGCTYTEGTVAVSMTGSGKTITLASDQEIYDLSISGDTALASDIDIGNELTVQPGITLDAGIGLYVIAIKGDSDTPVLGYGLFIGWLYLDGTAELQTVQVGELSAGYLFTQWETHIDIDGALWLNVTPDAEYVNITITSVDPEATFGAPVMTWTATGENDIAYQISRLVINDSYVVMNGDHAYYRDTGMGNGSAWFVIPGSTSPRDMVLAHSEFQQIIDWTYYIIPALAGIFLLIGLMGYMTGQLGSMGSTGERKRKKR